MRSGEEMREEFEKLKYIAEKLPYIKWSDELECYVDNGLASGIASWVNGAMYAYQEQQNKIDEVKKHMEKIKNFNSKVDAGYDPEFVAGFIDAFIDSVDVVLK